MVSDENQPYFSCRFLGGWLSGVAELTAYGASKLKRRSPVPAQPTILRWNPSKKALGPFTVQKANWGWGPFLVLP